MIFNDARWIWRDAEALPDEYADFLCKFNVPEPVGGKYVLRISADSNYSVFINGTLAAFGQYPDYPEYKVYDEINITEHIIPGMNRMIITVWYYGIDSQTYIKGKAGLLYELCRGGDIIAVSSCETFSRLSVDNRSGLRRSITSQLGLTFSYDMTKNDGYIYHCDDEFTRSREIFGITYELHKRPVERLMLEKRLPVRVVRSGTFKWKDVTAPPELRMRDASLTDLDVSQLPLTLSAGEGDDGVFLIVDLGCETAGFPELDASLDVTVPDNASCQADALIGYGEHIIDGRCRTAVGSRSFTAEYTFAAGGNRYLNTFRRFGCRYLQLFCVTKRLIVSYLGIRPTTYPVIDCGIRPVNPLRKKIYDTCVNTLRQCMHEHYEDCPWREQALYTMDSRNQMLCGYYAFGEYNFARASLLLISKGVRADGLLSLCYPAGIDYPIPAFSLIYFIQMKEYIAYSGDVTLAKELYGMLTALMDVFVRRIDGTGLIKTFEGCWNFYEWSEGMSGAMMAKGEDIRYEAPLNAFLALALRAMAYIAKAVGKTEAAITYINHSESISTAIADRFYDPEAGLFKSYDNSKYSVLTNSLCMLCGAAKDVYISHILQILSTNGADKYNIVTVPNTLSMNSFRFDALLAEDMEKYAPLILAELDRDYGYMLNEGATSFWETIKGAADFGGAGSLCHGWSALPIYYYSILKG